MRRRFAQTRRHRPCRMRYVMTVIYILLMMALWFLMMLLVVFLSLPSRSPSLLTLLVTVSGE